MFIDYFQALILIFFAELGDKTQFLSIAFATKYPIKKILIGVAIGSFLNHGLAISFGRILIKFVSGDLINFIAALMFIYFAFSSLIHEDEEIKKSNNNHGAIFNVALAFFIGELGDKTQLAALSLAIDSKYAFMTLLGTVSGMIIISSLSIYIGLKLCKTIPEYKLKIFAFIIFIIFAILKLYNLSFIHIDILIIVFIVLLIISFLKLKSYIKKNNLN